ncbi:MAG TPA: heme-binding protein, partial [Cellvibrionaceae bacterium]|nr:heme-binding protein [Cellvibrionaceae bacterium]
MTIDVKITDLPYRIQVIEKPNAETTTSLGPLANLVGTWKSAPGAGWNVIAVPGTFPSAQNDQGFCLEVIPFLETLTFQPATIVAGNRGPVVNGTQEDQAIVGLVYEQTVISDCGTDFCAARGFPKGSVIHKETGMFLNITDFNNDLNVARLSIIPHGNSVLALGKSIEDTSGPVTIPFGSASIAPIGGNLGYAEGPQFTIRQFPEFDQSNPNQILADTVSKQTLNSVTTFIMSTNNGTGGILNIPFIQNNVKAANMDCIFWIEEVADGAGQFLQLQYTQTISLVFPRANDPQKTPITWPHVDVNTLRKV